MKKSWLFAALLLFAGACSKKDSVTTPPVITTGKFNMLSIQISGGQPPNYYHTAINPTIRIAFSAPVSHASATSSTFLTLTSGAGVTINTSYSNNDSVLIIQPTAPLSPITAYNISVGSGLVSQQNVALGTSIKKNFTTAIDSTDKFPQISDSALLTLVEQKTFTYFWDFGHPVSGMARERNTSGDVVTTGGTGFGIMAMIVGIQRNFISRADGLTRLATIVNFLSTKASSYHGAFPHWMNGVTGATVPFSQQDDGADLVETSYLMQGLLSARQYFNGSASDETALRTSINTLWNGVQWNWFRQGGQQVLTWHWSPNVGFAINQPINGWDEAMIVYALAASSNIDSNRIPKSVYDNGWALNGGIKNGNTYFGVTLPLGPPEGGPLFFAHYSFLGINPNGLTDTYANYLTQNTAQATINYNYCVLNPLGYNGYSNVCWGLTASDDNLSGYSAHSPTNDLGVITPTAAISSLPYTPSQSMDALHFFYYKLGDKIWGQYGFTDAFNLSDPWFADSYLAIDQGPEIVMIENYRSGLLWNLFMSCPEVKTGMKSLGFQSTNLN